jgi:hypothetical protein
MDITFTIGGTKSKNNIFDDKYDELLGVITAPEIDSKNMLSDENEALIFWINGRTIYPKLLGGSEDTLSNTCQGIIGLIVKDSYSIHTLAKSLRDNLIMDNIIGEETTYQQFMNNGKLKSLMYNTIKLHLSDSIKLSKFGGGIVSDFDLIFNLQVTQNFYDRMKELKIAEGTETFEKLRCARGVVRRFVTKIRDGIIVMMDLPETPTKEDLKKIKEKKKKIKTKEDVKESIEKSKESLKLTHNTVITSSNDGDSDAESGTDDVADSIQKIEFVELCDKRKFLGQRSSENKPSLDEYATHREVVEPLIAHLDLSASEYAIWDPCCGSLNAICNIFHDRGFETLKSDIQNLELEEFTQKDFLKHEEVVSSEIFIITNPPWSQNKLFLHKLVSMNVPFCCLLKLDVLGTKYFKDVLSSKSSDYSFHGLPLPKGRFYCVETGKDIQMSGVFWLIGNYIPRGYETALEQRDCIRTCPLIIKNVVEKAIKNEIEDKTEDNTQMEI